MDNNVEEEKKEEVVEETPEETTIEDNNQDLYIEEDYEETGSGDNKDNKELIKKLMKLMIIIVVGIVGLFIILWFVSLFRTQTYTYEEVEEIMKDAAISYFKDHKKSLPKRDQKVEISVNTLVNNEYMDSLSDYLGEDTDCNGKVSVKKVDSKYAYTPYLTCGTDYSSEELYKEITKNFVTSGDGLYNINGTYVFRGENVKNYVKLDKALWRVVKITPDKNIILILDSEYGETYLWDDRYNKNIGYNAGINDYKASRIRDFLKTVYNNKDEDYRVLSNNDKSKMEKIDVCISKRSINSTVKDNSVECSEILNDQKVGLLTVSDYMTASIDKNCIKDLDESCQNYNYLSGDQEWLLATAVKNNTEEVFMVDGGVIITTPALTYANIRPVIALNESVMIKSGKGTKKHPYKVK